MLKPVCVTCGTFFKPLKNGIRVQEMRPGVNRARAGKASKQDWRPHKLWEADLWQCHSCGMEIVVGSGMQAIVEHYMLEYEEILKAKPPYIDVCDC